MNKQGMITKLIILLGIIFLGYIILTHIYKVENDFFDNSTGTTQKSVDKFSDLILNNVNANDQVDTDILNYYKCYFNPNTVNNLMTGSNISNINYINNSASITNKLNTLSANIDKLMIQLNNDILNNINGNYARAHTLNKQREEMKKTLDYLPLKNI